LTPHQWFATICLMKQRVKQSFFDAAAAAQAYGLELVAA
jgi:hypothetical protein